MALHCKIMLDTLWLYFNEYTNFQTNRSFNRHTHIFKPTEDSQLCVDDSDGYKITREGIELQQLELEFDFIMESKENVVRAILLGIICTCSLASANYGTPEKPISVVLKGRVVCDACSLDEINFSDNSDIISGAAVAVECGRGLNRKTNAGLVSMDGETDENGEFKVELPASVISSILLSFSTDHNSSLKGYCSAQLLSSPKDKCNVHFPVTSSSDLLTLTSDCHGIRTFTFPSLSYRSQSKLYSHSDITCSSDHKSLRAGRALHEVSKELSSSMDASFPHANLPPLPKPVFGFPPLHLPHPDPVSGFPPLHFPHPHPVSGLPPLHLPHPNPVSGFPPLQLPHPKLSLPPLPAGTPLPGPSLFH